MIYESYILHIFYNIQKYTIIPSFTIHFEVMVAATLWKGLRPPMPKRSNDSYLQKNREPYRTYILSMTCQIDVVNKKLVPPLNLNKPFSKTY